MEIQLPLFEPTSSWVMPHELPDLSDAKQIAIDTEDQDPRLKTLGPGFVRSDGRVAGISVATDTGFSGYFPIAHALGPNLDQGIVSDWARRTFSQRERDYIFTNAPYDIGWLSTLGVRIEGRIHDISIADTLIDEEADAYGLDAISKRWLGEGKDETLLDEALKDYGFVGKGDLWKLPAKLVGPYAVADAVKPLRIHQLQLVELERQGLLETYRMECKLTPILAAMHQRGVRVDLAAAEELNARWLVEERQILRSLGNLDIWSTDAVARLCRKEGIAVPKTAKGNDSVKSDFIEAINHPVLNQVKKARTLNRLRQIYVQEGILEGHIKGRIHGQYVQMHTDEGGTRTMRLAMKNPNLQQVPKRSKLIDAKAIRKLYLPEDGEQWAKKDYWSQEPVLQVHYGLLMDLPGAKEVAAQFEQGIKLYTYIEKATGGRCSYDQAKEVVLGRSYGMGKAKMSARMHIAEDECGSILEAFDLTVPYINLLAKHCDNKAKDRGFIRAIAGHQRHFNLWQPRQVYGQERQKFQAVTFERAKIKWPGVELERAYTYKAFNGLIQGSAAGQTKMALIAITEACGIPPLLTVHDEINDSVKDEKTARLQKEIMENVIPLKSPARADLDLGNTWC